MLVLEPLNHMYGVVQAADALKLKVVVIHSMDLITPAPFDLALESIDFAIKTDQWLDLISLWELIQPVINEYEISGTYGAAEATLPFAAFVNEKLGLPGTPLAVVQQCLDKEFVRNSIREHGLTQIQCLSQEELIELDSWPFKGSGYFKPVNGSGSANVKKVHKALLIKSNSPALV